MYLCSVNGNRQHRAGFLVLRKGRRLCLLLCLCALAVGLSSCDNLRFDGRCLQREVLRQERFAMRKTHAVIRALENNDIDSLHILAHQKDNVMFFIYKGDEVFYWSHAWLNSSGIPFKRVFDQWKFREWNNAYGLCRRTHTGDYFVLTVIPLKYNYSITGEQLSNRFIAPFRGNDNWTLKNRTGDDEHYYPIYSDDGTFLFSLCTLPRPSRSEVSPNILRNFSYHALFTSEDRLSDVSQFKLRVYYSLTIILFVLLAAVALFWLIRCRGFRSMKLGGKFQLILVSLLTVVFVSNFILSVVYIRKMFIVRQEHNLEKKAQYLQSALQNLYFWDVQLSPFNTPSLNIDLRDLSYAYETDIHVYDMQGRLIGSSVPQLFDEGILSRYIAPEPFFGNSPRVQYEHIGGVRYLVAYTEFYNGNYGQIGYIALPYFISQDQIDSNVDNYVVWLLPLYLALLLLTIFVVWLAARILSTSLGTISKNLQNYRLGEKGAHIDYFFNDEVGELVHHYNEMMDALAESTQRLARTEREAAWRTMARQVAHEINNSLTPMKLTLQQMQRLKGTPRFDDYFNRSTQVLIDQTDNLSNIAASFSSFAKMPEVNPTEVDVAQKLSSCIALLGNNLDDIPLRYIGPGSGVMAIADADQITQVFTNIVRNATQAMAGQENGDIIIILKELPVEQQVAKGLDNDSRWVEISFSDNGPGIPLEVRDKVFMPNFTTKSTGMGLGLAISKNIVEGGGGKICFQTSEKGTTFFVYLRKKL